MIIDLWKHNKIIDPSVLSNEEVGSRSLLGHGAVPSQYEVKIDEVTNCGFQAESIRAQPQLLRDEVPTVGNSRDTNKALPETISNQ